MAFRNNAYATVWETKPSTNYTDVRLSCSRKSKQTGEYETDFSGFVRFIGDAHKMAAGLKPRDRIQLLDVACSNNYSKEKNTTYNNFQCFAFAAAESSGNRSTAKRASTSRYNNSDIPSGTTDEELPFN